MASCSRPRAVTLEYERMRTVSPEVGVVLAANPSAMTLDGTNTWLLHGADQPDEAVVVDPGPDDDAHLDAVVAAAGRVVRILLTHGHPDHSDGARRLHERTGAPVSALDPRWQFGGEGLHEGDVVSAAGVERAGVVHARSHRRFAVVPARRRRHGGQAVLTGDTVLGRGSTLIAEPDGDLGAYLASLRRLSALGPIRVLPGHGPDLDDAHAAAEAYLAHRRQRLDQVRGRAGRPAPRAGSRQRDRPSWPPSTPTSTAHCGRRPNSPSAPNWPTYAPFRVSW